MPTRKSITLDEVQILVSPTGAEFPVDGVELRVWAGSILDDDWKAKGECALLVHRVLSPGEGVPGLEDRQVDDGLVAQVADAIRATVNHPWPDGGPHFDLGQSILGFFEDDGWHEIFPGALRGTWMFADGDLVSTPPVVWRTMPPAPTEGRK